LRDTDLAEEEAFCADRPCAEQEMGSNRQALWVIAKRRQVVRSFRSRAAESLTSVSSTFITAPARLPRQYGRYHGVFAGGAPRPRVQ